MFAYSKRKILLVTVVAFAVAVVMTVLPACLGLGEEAAPAAAPAAASAAAPAAAPAATPAPGGGGSFSSQNNVGTWQYTVEAMGWVGVILICLSVAGLALLIEFGVNLRREKMIPSHIVAELEGLFEQEQYEDAIQLCESQDCLLSRIMAGGLEKLGGNYTKMVQAVQEVADKEVTRVNQRLGHLALIGTIAPMFGLLGTVTGMIIAFNVIASKAGTANPADLAYGISQALINTLIGLVVAIPVLTGYTLFKNKVALIVMDAGAIVGELMERFRPATEQ
jgi:biopolymer transport protein ExbB